MKRSTVKKFGLGLLIVIICSASYTYYKINKNNLIWRVDNKELNQNIDDFRCASGYFNEFKIHHIDELNNIIKRNYQTLSYFGVDKNEFVSFFTKKRPLGIDRVVPIGKTLDFSLNWDGYDIINQMSRVIEII